MRERERGREREKHRESEKEREREKQRERERERTAAEQYFDDDYVQHTIEPFRVITCCETLHIFNTKR